MPPTKTPSQAIINHYWVRLILSPLLAALLVAVVLLLPVLTGGRLSSPAEPGRAGLSALFDPLLVRAANGVTLTKYASSSTVTPGGLITYTLRITNNSGVAITDVTITDTIPANTLCQDMDAPPEWLTSQAACQQRDPPASALAWVLQSPSTYFGGVIADGESVALTYTVQVDQPLPDGIGIVNADISYGVEVISPTANFYDDTGSQTVTVTVTAPAWQISKTVSPTPTVEPGSELVYTITVTNAGSLATSGLYTITDQIPPNTSFVSASDSGINNGGVVTWEFSTSLNPGQARSVNFRVSVTSPLTDGTQIVNQTYAITGGNVYSPASGSPITVTVRAPVTLTLTKQDSPDPVQAGARLVYTLTVTNDSTSKGPADNVVVTDTVPANTVFEDAGIVGGSASINKPAVGGSGVVTWTITSPNPLPVNQSVTLTMAVRVASPLTNGTIITNSAYAVTATNAVNPTAGASVTTTVQSSPNITFSKRVQPQTVSLLQPVTYTIVITNSGNETATNVPFTDAIQAPDFTPPTATWTVPVITGTDLAGQPGVVTYTLVATSGLTPGSYGNIVTATVNGSDIVLGPVATVTVIGQADLQLSKRAVVTQALAGQPITYTITVTNAPGSDTLDVRITDTFTSGVLDSVTPSKGTCSGSGPVVCTINSFTNTETITLVLRSSSAFSGVLTNTAQITAVIAGVTDPNPLDNSDLATTTVRLPVADLEASKQAGAATVIAGNNITYTITITNNGPDRVGVVVTDNYTPSGAASFNACSGSCSASVGSVTWSNLPELNSGDAQTLVLTLTTGSIYSGTLTNTVSITFSTAYSNAIDPGPNPNTDTVTTTVRRPTADLEISKIAGAAAVIAGNDITYTLTITNHGPDAVGVVVADTFDPASAASFSTCSDGCSAVGNNISWDSLPTLNPGVSQTLVLTLTTAAYDGVLTNTATVTFSSTSANAVDPGPNPNTDAATVTVRTLTADFQVRKTLQSASTVQVGDLITYTITITNAGPDTASAVLTDTFTNNPTVSSITGASCTGLGTTGPVYCNLPNLTGTTVITLVLDTATSREDFVVNKAEVGVASAGITDPSPGNNSYDATWVWVNGAPALVFTKSASPASGSTVTPGQALVYNLSVTNLSTATATASNVVITDTVPGGVGVVSVSTGGSSSQNGSQYIFSTASLGIGQSLTATLQVTVTATTSGTVITNQAEAASSDGGLGTQMTSHTVVTAATGSSTVYLPIVLKNFTMMPDLTITNFSITPANPSSSDTVVVSITIQNVGNASTEEGFWVDFYIDPDPVPDETMGERRWEKLGSAVSPKKGIAWKITSLLAPGESLTLTSNSAAGTVAPDPDFSAAWLADPRFVSGTNNLYSYVDSYDSALVPEGEILESNESNNRAAITGLGVAGVAVQGESVPPPAADRPDVNLHNN